MVLFPNCKINLGLHVLGKRADGYHDIDTAFYPLPLHDALEANTCSRIKKEPTLDFDLQIAGNPVPGNIADNLCTRAWQLIKADFPDISPVKMHLLKAIPSGAGLGGGSSNGAFTLLLLNQLLELHLPVSRLLEYALLLGSDCPFFVINKPAIAAGRGELLREIELPLGDDHYFILVNPGIHISTAWAFSQLQAKNLPAKRQAVAEVIQKPVSDWKTELVNDFELPVYREYPQLEDVRNKLYGAGAEYASLTGTGSCIYGIFRKKTAVQNLQLDKRFRVYVLNQAN